MRICCVDRGALSLVSTEAGSKIDAQVDLISQGLSKIGHDVTLVCFGTESYVKRPFKIHAISAPLKNKRIGEIVSSIYFGLGASFWLLRKRTDFDVIHFQGSIISAFLYSILSVFARSPPCTIAHAPPSSDASKSSVLLPGEWYRSLLGRIVIFVALKRCFDFCSRVIVINETSRKQLTHYFNNSAKMRIVQFTLVDTNMFAANHRSTSDKFVTTCVARVQPRKNQLDVLKVAKLLAETDVAFKFVGPSSNDYMKTLQNFIRSNNLEDVINFTGYVKSYAELAEILEGSDLYVLLSTSESGIPTTIAQALSCGLPLILSKRFENEEILVEAGANFVDPKNSKDIANLILKYARDKKLTQSIRNKAYQTALRYFDMAVVCSNLERVLKESIGNPKISAKTKNRADLSKTMVIDAIKRSLFLFVLTKPMIIEFS